MTLELSKFSEVQCCEVLCIANSNLFWILIKKKYNWSKLVLGAEFMKFGKTYLKVILPRHLRVYQCII